MDREEVLSLSVSALRSKLGELKLSTHGLKDELQKRLLEYYGLDSTHVGDGVKGFVDEDGDPAVGPVSERDSEASQRDSSITSMYTLRDVADSLSSFSGTSAPDIIQWLAEFEETAAILKWSPLQKYVYGKQLLVGAAKLFMKSQRGICDWDSLKKALESEFEVRYSSAEVIRQIRNRRLNKNETLIEYLYCIMEIAGRINLDESSIVEYFIEGIPDSRINKTILYQASNIKELKTQIKVYEKTRFPPRSSYRGKEATAANSKDSSWKESKPEVGRRCFKCGDKSHVAKDCTKQYKCFKCQQFGHRSFECKVRSTEKRAIKIDHDQANMVKRGPGLVFKDVLIEGKVLSALIDTGCDICLMRLDALFIFNEVNLVTERVKLSGIGESEINTIGHFDCIVEIDGLKFETTFYVVGERDILHTIMIGNSLLRKAEVILRDGEVTFRQPEERNLLLEEFGTICLNIEECKPEERLELSHLDKTFSEKILEMVNNYKPAKNFISPVKMKIVLTDDIPIYQRPRRIPYADQVIVDNQVKEWLEAKIIQPSFSEYSSPVVLAAKKDGTKRLCCDYRKLNQKIVRDNFPMPLIDEVLNKLQKGKVYTTLDLKNGFFHVPLEEASRKYTAFVTSNGQYEFLYVPFGISNSPAVFTRFISVVLRDLIEDSTIIVYMDDIIIPSKDLMEGLEKLQVVLKRTAEKGLQIKWEKCQFLREEVNFLGYIIANSSIRPSKEKVRAVKDYPIPVDRKAVQRFLGLTSYFRKFIEDYAIKAKPLTDLLRKNVPFKITGEVLTACQQLKEALTNSPVLRLYDPTAITEVHADASKFGYGAVLLQKGADDQQLHPVQYMSRRTKPYEEKYHSYELEVLAIVESLKKWRVYLLGIPFKIVTDCNAFRLTMRKDDVPARISRWAMFLQEFSYEIEHRSGTRMKHVDALSRMACLISQSSLTHRIKYAQESDECTKAIRAVLEHGAYEDFYLQNGVLYKDPVKELIVIPVQLEEEIIRLAHNQGHFGVYKTRELLEKQYYIPRLGAKVPNVVRSCIECIITEAKAGKKEGYLNPIDKDDRPLATYHIDHVGPMEVTKKAYNYLFVVVDGFTKFVWLHPTKSTDTKAVIECLERQASIFGNPQRIITDRGPAFTSQTFSDYCTEENIQHLTITTGVPRGNGQVERIHKIVLPMLAKLCAETPQNWYKHVRRVQMVINSTPPRSTRVSPFRLLTGVEMKLPDYPDLREKLNDETIRTFDDERNDLRAEARENIERIQRENCKTYNARRKPEDEYAVNELVAIKRTQFGTGLKLKGKYLGPYKISKKLPHGRYEVEKVGSHEGPIRTTTVAEYMKRWQSEPYCRQEGRM